MIRRRYYLVRILISELLPQLSYTPLSAVLYTHLSAEPDICAAIRRYIRSYERLFPHLYAVPVIYAAIRQSYAGIRQPISLEKMAGKVRITANRCA